MTKNPAYKINSEGKIIYLGIMGVHDIKDVHAMAQDIRSIAVREQQPMDMLIEVSGAGVPKREALVESVKLMNDMQSLRYIAAYSAGGTSKARILAVKGFLKATGSGDRFKFFRDEAGARTWLEQVGDGKGMKRLLRKPGK
jgi:hypothetical protein